MTTLSPTAAPARSLGHEHPFRRPAHSDRNVGETERWTSIGVGGLLTLYGLKEGSALGLLIAGLGGALLYRGLSGHCPMYAALGVSTEEPLGPATSVQAGHGVKVDIAMTINRPRRELYDYWRDLSNLPHFMRHLQSVTCNGAKSHWAAKGPLGMTVEWDAEIINEKVDELIAWRSLEGSEVDTAGSVHFQPAPRGEGTEVRVILKYDPPAGKVGASLARLFGQAPEQQIREDLRRFKQLMEAGEIPTTEGQPSCRARQEVGRFRG